MQAPCSRLLMSWFEINPACCQRLFTPTVQIHQLQKSKGIAMHIRKIFILCLTMFLPFNFLACTKEPASTETAPKTITMETTLGDMVLELYDTKAPITCANFRRYVNEGYFNGLIFHRVIPGFVIQGGGFEPGMKPRPAKYPPIKNEADNGLQNERYTLSMARTSNVNSATSQFFINLTHNHSLDHVDKNARGYGYAVFGKVIKGMKVADKIAARPTTMKMGFRDVPQEDVIINKAYEN
jgi:cyclophilin family peptidyl-prolyl cis-trans isomerase